jgi:hypothetical protein
LYPTLSQDRFFNQKLHGYQAIQLSSTLTVPLLSSLVHCKAGQRKLLSFLKNRQIEITPDVTISALEAGSWKQKKGLDSFVSVQRTSSETLVPFLFLARKLSFLLAKLLAKTCLKK